MRIQEAAHALHTDWCGSDVLFTGVSTDSRTLKQGDLFIALSGEKFDGCKFIANAEKKGAVAAMVKQEAGNLDLVSRIPLVKVKDTRLGLGQLAAYWRERFSMPLVGITGSNGKTTVKEMVASICRRAAACNRMDETGVLSQVLATEGNLNNEIGVPQMLLRLRETHRYAVIEMGMNHTGEISYLTQMAKPNVAVITNAGAAHIEGLGSVEAVARAKGEIFEGLDQQGTAVINADDAYAPLWRQFAGNRRLVDFGLGKYAQVSAVFQASPTGSIITLKLPDGNEDVALQVSGEHNVLNALAAAAVAIGIGINKQDIAAGLESFKGVPGRMQRKNGLHSATLIDDSYNANPESVRAALAVLSAATGKKILVLGDMGELGKCSIELHRSIGKAARLAGLDRLLTLGELSAYAATEFGEGALHFKHIDELLIVAEKLLAADVTLLVKGSRFMQMERVVKQFEI